VVAAGSSCQCAVRRKESVPLVRTVMIGGVFSRPGAAFSERGRRADNEQQQGSSAQAFGSDAQLTAASCSRLHDGLDGRPEGTACWSRKGRTGLRLR